MEKAEGGRFGHNHKFLVWDVCMHKSVMHFLTIDECLLLSCCAWIFFFLQNTVDPDQPAPYLIRTHTVFISACK